MAKTSKDPASCNARAMGEVLRQTSAGPAPKQVETIAGAAPPDRRMLWIDAVGGFLVCLDDEIVLGQPSSGVSPAVPILADLSRRHAILRRETGAYVIEPIGPTRLEGHTLNGATVLADRQLIELGESVQLRFTRPHALSATARLKIESGHKTSPSADAVLLMAESCVLGPKNHSHILCRGWREDILVYRDTKGLVCRSSTKMAVNGVETNGSAPLTPGTRIEGEEYSLSIEQA